MLHGTELWTQQVQHELFLLMWHSKAVVQCCGEYELFWIPFSTSKAACIAAISDRKLLISAKADSMSAEAAHVNGSAVTEFLEMAAIG